MRWEVREFWAKDWNGNIVLGTRERGAIGSFRKTLYRSGDRDYDTGRELYSSHMEYFPVGWKYSTSPPISLEEILAARPPEVVVPVSLAKPVELCIEKNPYEGQKCWQCQSNIASNGFCVACGCDNVASE